MNHRLLKNFKRSAVVHVLIVALFLLAPLVWHLRQRNKPHEIVTYIDLQTVVPEIPEAAPVAEVKPPEPKVIPEPPKKKKIKKSTKRIRREPDKPKPKKPGLTEEEIKKLLAQGAKISDKPSAPTDFPSWYYALVRQTLYEAWDQPGAAAGSGLSALVEIRIERNGTVSRRKMTRPSGNAIMDESVMKAVQSVRTLKPLPNTYTKPYKDITIDFELTL